MNQNINVDLIPKFAVYGNLYFSQYDVGREAIINLVNGSTEYEIPSGATVTLAATKPSGLGFTQNCTFEGNQITVVCTAEMTDEAGRFPCELRIVQGSTILGTANFTFNVERSPHPEGTTDGTADSVISQITLAYETAMDNIEHSGGLTSAIKNAILNCFQKVAWIDQNGQTYYNALSDAFFAVTNITLNASSLLFNSIGSTQQLTATLVPSDSTAQVQWESSDTSVATVSSSGLVTSVADGNATITASVGEVSATCSVSVVEITVESLNAVLNASGHTFYVGDDINDIKPYLTVTATYSDSTTATIPSGSYTLSGSLANDGENTITVTYEGVSTTVSVTAISAELVSISAVYTQSGTVYDNQTLDSLKADLVVTALWDDSSTTALSANDYSLSGTLAVGTSTITVSYEGQTDTFDVTVTETPRAWTPGTPLTIGTVTAGNININTGVEEASTSFNRTDYIDIEGAHLVQSRIVSTKASTGGNARFYFYDTDKDFISSKSFTSANNALTITTVPADTKYVRFVASPDYIGDSATNAYEFVPYATPTVSYTAGTITVDSTNGEAGVRLDTTTGGTIASTNGLMSNYIACYGYQSVSLYNVSDSSDFGYVYVGWYDKNHNYIGANTAYGANNLNTKAIPFDEIAYFRLSNLLKTKTYTITFV